MKKLEIFEMETIKGGEGNALDYVCGGVTVGAVLVKQVFKLALGPVGGAIATGCVIYGTGRLFDWW